MKEKFIVTAFSLLEEFQILSIVHEDNYEKIKSINDYIKRERRERRSIKIHTQRIIFNNESIFEEEALF